jgi:toxin ParE1/3/4
MALKIFRHRQVVVDLIEIAAFISHDDLSIADRFLAAAETCFRQLADAPELGALDEFDSPYLRGIRRWRVKHFEKYLVFYRVTEERIDVIRVLHGSRDIDSLFNEQF